MQEVVCMAVLSKSQMSEEDIKFHYITPAITAKWNNQHITLETKITDGRINLKGNIVAREKPKRADYVLYLSANNPIAIVEAKDNNHTVSHGLQQAMTYAQMLDVPFAFSSNGDGFAEHDFLTGKERTFGLDEYWPDRGNLVLSSGYAERLQAFQQDQAYEVGTLCPCGRMVERPQRNSVGRVWQGQKVYRAGNQRPQLQY